MFICPLNFFKKASICCQLFKNFILKFGYKAYLRKSEYLATMNLLMFPNSHII